MSLPKPPQFKLAYDAKEASRLLPIGETRIYELLHSGELRHFKVGNKFVISHAEIERWLMEHRTEQASLERDALTRQI